MKRNNANESIARLTAEVERLKGYMTPGQIEDSEHMRVIVPRMLRAETEVQRLTAEVAEMRREMEDEARKAFKNSERADRAEAALAAANERAEKLEKALRMQAHHSGSWEEENARVEAAEEALRPATPPEAKPLPLGHEFVRHHHWRETRCEKCGAPKSAH